jgi:hypothetical protein
LSRLSHPGQVTEIGMSESLCGLCSRGKQGETRQRLVGHYAFVYPPGRARQVCSRLARLEEYLSQGNGLKLDGLKYRLGRKLKIDVRTESIESDPEANRLLTRDYRKPFAVPDKFFRCFGQGPGCQRLNPGAQGGVLGCHGARLAV